MKLQLAIYALLVLTQAASPVPRQTTNDDTAKGHTSKADSRTPQKPPDSLATVVPKVPADPDQATDSKNTNNKKPEPIEINKLPSVSVSRDNFDVITLVFSFVLLIVGSFGVRAAYRTLRAVEKQAGLMQGQLTAMQESTKIIMSKERAQISVRLESLKVTNAGSPQVIGVEIIFSGLTPAYKVESGAVAFIGDLFPDSPPKATLPIPKVPPMIKPGDDPIRSVAFVLSPLPVQQQDIFEIVEGVKFLHVLGFIRYRDTFYDVSQKERETSFRWTWRFFVERNPSAELFLSSPGRFAGYWQEREYKETQAN